MKVEIRCGHCSHALSVNEESLGQRVRCPHCQGEFEAVVLAHLGEADADPVVSGAITDQARAVPGGRELPAGPPGSGEKEMQPLTRRSSALPLALILGAIAGLSVLVCLGVSGVGVVMFVYARTSVRMAQKARVAEEQALMAKVKAEQARAKALRAEQERARVRMERERQREQEKRQQIPAPRPPLPPVVQPQPPVLPPAPKPPPAFPRMTMTCAKKVDPYHAAAISPDSKSALVAFPQGKLEHFSCPDFKSRGTYRLSQDALEAVLDAKGNLYGLCTSLQARTRPPRSGGMIVHLNIYAVADLLNGKEEAGERLTPKKVTSARGKLRDLILSPQGDYLYYLDVSQQTIGRLSTAEMKVEQAMPRLVPGAKALCMTPDGSALYVLSKEGSLHKIDPAQWKKTQTYKLGGKFNDVQALNDGRVFLIGEDIQVAKVGLPVGQSQMLGTLDTKDPGKVKKLAPIHRSNDILLSPDQKYLYRSCWLLSPPSIEAYLLKSLAEANGRWQVCASCDKLQANFSARGKLVVSPNGGFLMCDAGVFARIEDAAKPAP